MKIVETFVSEDGRTFTDKEACLKHENGLSAFKSIIRSKIGDYTHGELRLGGARGEAILDSLPFTAPWMSPFGACLINITDIRRDSDGVVEFQLADEQNVPYDDGATWRRSEAFYSQWPQ